VASELKSSMCVPPWFSMLHTMFRFATYVHYFCSNVTHVFLKCWMSEATMLDVFVFFSEDCDMILTCNMLFKRNWDLLHIMFLFFATWICSNVAEDFCYMSQIL
jgi:hypothetical protein